MLYHTIAMTIVAIEVYFMTEMLPMKRYEQVVINATITIGYLTAVILACSSRTGGITSFHGLFLVGNHWSFSQHPARECALPWRKEYRLEKDYLMPIPKTAWIWNGGLL